MFNLVYGSTASRRFSDDELFEMLVHWRETNARLGITGLLLYKEGAFIQALEGDEQTVRAMYAAIREDTRHCQVFTIQAMPIPKRQFPDWSMGFKNLHHLEAPAIPGYNPHPDFSPAGGQGSWRASVAMQLLATFAQEN